MKTQQPKKNQMKFANLCWSTNISLKLYKSDMISFNILFISSLVHFMMMGGSILENTVILFVTLSLSAICRIDSRCLGFFQILGHCVVTLDLSIFSNDYTPII